MKEGFGDAVDVEVSCPVVTRRAIVVFMLTYISIYFFLTGEFTQIFKQLPDGASNKDECNGLGHTPALL